MPRRKLRRAVDSGITEKAGSSEGFDKDVSIEGHVETGDDKKEGNLVHVEIGEDEKGGNLEQGNTQLVVIIDNEAAEQEIETRKDADAGDSSVDKDRLKQETEAGGTKSEVNVNKETETSSKEKDMAELGVRADDVDKETQTSTKQKEIAQEETGADNNGAQTPSDNAEDDEYLEDVRVCDTCGDVGQEHNLVNCHRCDSGAEHIYCMREKLEEVPEEPWTCFTCIQKDRERERAQRVSSLRNSNKDVVQEKQQKQEVSSSLERKDDVSPKNVVSNVSEAVEQKDKEDGETSNLISNKAAEEIKDTPQKRKADALPSPDKTQPNKLLKTASSKALASNNPGVGANGKQGPQPSTKTGAPVNGKRVPPPSPKVANGKGLPEKEKVNPAVPKKTVPVPQPLLKPTNGKPNVSKGSLPTPKPAKQGPLDVAAIQAMQESLLKSSKPKVPPPKKEDPLARTTATTKWKDSGKDEKAAMRNISQTKQTEDVHGKSDSLKPTLSKSSSFKQTEDVHGKSDLLKPPLSRTSSFKQTEDVHGKTDALKPTLSKSNSIKQMEDPHGKVDFLKPSLSKTSSFKETREDVSETAAPPRKCYKCNNVGHSALYCPNVGHPNGAGAMKLLTPFLDSKQPDTQPSLPRLPLQSSLPGLLPTPTNALPAALAPIRPPPPQVPVTSTSLQLGVKPPSTQLQTTPNVVSLPQVPLPHATPSTMRIDEGRDLQPETKEIAPAIAPRTASNSDKLADNEDLPPGYAAHNLDEEYSSHRKDRSSRERDRSPDWKRRERERYHRSGRDKERRSHRSYRRSRSRSSERRRDRRRERSKSRSRTPPRRHDSVRSRYRSSSPSRSDSSEGQRRTRSRSRSPSRRHDRRRSPSESRRRHSTRYRRSRSRSPGRRRERSRSKSRSRSPIKRSRSKSPTKSPRKRSAEPVYHNFLLSVGPATSEQEILPAPDLNLVPEISENPKGGLNLELVPPTDHNVELSLAVPQYRQMGKSWVKVAEEAEDSVKDWALNLGL